MWNIDGAGDGDEVDPQNIQHKYGSAAGARDGVDSPT